MQSMVLVTLEKCLIFLRLAGIQDFFFFNLTRPSFMERYYQSIVETTCLNPENLILSSVCQHTGDCTHHA